MYEKSTGGGTVDEGGLHRQSKGTEGSIGWRERPPCAGDGGVGVCNRRIGKGPRRGRTEPPPAPILESWVGRVLVPTRTSARVHVFVCASRCVVWCVVWCGVVGGGVATQPARGAGGRCKLSGPTKMSCGESPACGGRTERGDVPLTPAPSHAAAALQRAAANYERPLRLVVSRRPQL